MSRIDAAIVGGGIAGLTTAYDLTTAGLHCRLVEASPRLGGKITTERVDGFVIEGGPDAFITQKPWATELAQELGLTPRLLPTRDEDRRVYVVKDGRLVELPDGFLLAIPTKVGAVIRTPLVSWPAKIRMALDVVAPARREPTDESLADFIRRRFGRETLERIAQPMMAGIHSANPERLSIGATFGRFAQLERKYGSVIRGLALARHRAPKPPPPRPDAAPTSIFLSFREGLSELPAALAESLPSETVLSPATVVALEPPTTDHPDAFTVRLADGRTLVADRVVLAVPAYVAAGLVAPFAPAVAAGLWRIRYVSTATVTLSFPSTAMRRPLDGFGFVVPRCEDRPISACTWTSTKFEGRAPAGKTLVRTFVGGDGREEEAELPDDQLLELVRRELAELMGIEAEPELVRIYRWPRGTPQYDVGHEDRISALEAELPPGLHLAGAGYHGAGIPDCVRSGRRAAAEIVENGEWRMENSGRGAE